MWLGIIALADKLLGIVGTLLGWWKEASDETKKKRDAAQKDMDAAAKIGDYDAYWSARADLHATR